jgi:bacillolysin
MNNRIIVSLVLLLVSYSYIFSQKDEQNSISNFKTLNVKIDTTKICVNKDIANTYLNEIMCTDNGLYFKKCYFNENTTNEGKTDKLGYFHEKYFQYFKGIKIEYSDIRIHYKNKKMVSANGNYVKSLNIGIAHKISSEKAIKNAIEFVNAEKYIWEIPEEKLWLKNLSINKDSSFYPQPELVICKNYLNLNNDTFCLAYKLNIYAIIPLSRDYIYVDANTGDIINIEPIIKKFNGIANTRYSDTRTISTELNLSNYRLRDYSRGEGIKTYNMNSSIYYSSATDFTDNDNNWTSTEYDNSVKDNGALDAHWGAMMTYDYFFNIHGRNSYDDNGAALINYVHYGINYEDAFWNGYSMTYGDGYTNFDILTSLDIVAHEVAHGVCSYTANLAYSKESGAINEGISDIWAACVKNYATNNKPIWLYGTEIDLRGGHVAIRSLSNPNSESQPDTYGGLYWFNPIGCTPSQSNDYCGVHRNSGVMNYWFYLLSTGGSGTNDIGNAFNVTGISIDDAANILYRAESIYMTTSSTFSDTRASTIQSAIDLYGENSQQVISVISSWFAVGVGECTNLTLDNVTIDNDTTVRGCNIDVENVNINNGAKLLLKSENETNINGLFEVELGSELEI